MVPHADRPLGTAPRHLSDPPSDPHDPPTAAGRFSSVARASLRPVSGHVAWHWVQAQLAAWRSIWLATTRPDGRPHAVPVWFWWDGRAIYLMTGRDTRKGRNLAGQPEVVLHGGDGDDVVVLEGHADLVTDAAERARVDAAFRERYVDPGSGVSWGPDDAPTDLLVRVEVRRVMAWMYGTVAHRTDFVPPFPAAAAGRQP